MITALASFFSLSRFDRGWSQALRDSLLFGWIFELFAVIRAKVSAPSINKVGSLLQQLAYLATILLFSILALPQFTNDKGGLALISTAAMVIWIAGRLLGGKEERRFSAIDAVVLAYLGANIIATFSSHYLVQSVKGLSKVAVYIINYFLLTAVLSKNDNQDNGRLHKLIAAASLAGFVVSLYGLYQYKIGVAPLATWEDPTVESKGTRIYSTLGNPNLLAGYLIPLVPLSLSLAVTSFALKSQWQKWLSATIFLGVSAVIGLATVLTGSRGAFLALGAMAGAVAFALFCFVVAKHKKLIAPIVILLIVAVVAGVLIVHFKLPAFESRILSIFAGSEHSSNAYRLNVWRASARMFMDNWWFGVGPGNATFPLAYGLYMKSGFDALGTYCVPLEIGVECGVLGLLSAVVLNVALFARAHLLFWQGRHRWLALGLVTALIGLLVQGMVDTVFYRPQVQFLFWLVVAGITIIYKDERASKDESL